MKQKAFIKIPLLIAVIVSIVIVSTATTGVVLYKQRKLTPLVANISEVFKRTEEPIATESEMTKSEELPEYIETEQEAETKNKQDELRKQQETQRIVEEQQQKEIQQSEIYKNNILSMISLLKDSYHDQIEFIDQLISFLDSVTSDLEKLIEKNNDFYQRTTFKDLKQLISFANEIHLLDIKMLNVDRDMLNEAKKISKGKADAFTKLDTLTKSYNIISESDFVETGKILGKEFQEDKSIWELLDSVSKEIFKHTNESKEHLAEIIAMAESLLPQTTYEFSPRYETYYYSSPLDSTYKFLQDYYQREQLRALQNIGDQLYNIWRGLAY